MPKQKTHKGILKRIKITGRGKVKAHKGGTRHLLAHKSSKRKRALRRAMVQEGALGDALKRLATGTR
jgi:large subunit ribosomal protein L35